MDALYNRALIMDFVLTVQHLRQEYVVVHAHLDLREMVNDVQVFT